ncbi:MFS transporter [Micromonospora costi]|uniref:MFS transporter n=1 Tax=Micromonospora costi TaxID=1530042 RepID=A0A3A9ZXA3_9ACTN|nr:MFS transporter [Micromonospora costi]RKN52800.1 MFS transporter [Micromonospora costi]
MVATDERARDRRLALVVVALGATYGYDGAVMAGAQLFVTDRLGLSTTEQGTLHASTIVGLILGTLVAARLADAYGRRRTLVAAAAGFTLVATLSPVVAHLVWLDSTRLLLGVGMGVILVVTPIFIAESASAAARGRIGVLYQVATVAGVVSAFLVAYGLAESRNWRLMLWGSAVLAAVVVAVLASVPETPRWRPAGATRRAPAPAPVGAGAPIDAGAPVGAGAPIDAGAPVGVLRELFGARYRSVTLFVVALGFFAQITGVSAVGSFSPRIVQRMGYEGYFAILVVPALIQVAGLLAALASSFTVDRLGRRATLLVGTGIMAVGHALLVVTFAAGGTPVVGLVGLLCFSVGFNSGFGALIWVYAAEGYDDRLRTAGTTMMLLPNLLANFLLAQFFLTVLTALGGTATFTLLAGVTVLAWIFVLRSAPETRGRSLDAIHAYWQGGRRWPEQAGEPQPGRAGEPQPEPVVLAQPSGPPGP